MSPIGSQLLDKEGRKQLREAGRISSVGFEIVLATLLGFYGGQWLDGVFGTGPVLKWVGLAFGVAAGFRGLVYFAMRARKQGKI